MTGEGWDKEYLMGIRLYEIHDFQPYSEQWDHEHCCFCWAEFSTHNDDLHEGYCSTDKKRNHWICPKCYDDFKDEFSWRISKEDS
jgi:hypothetical protein